MERIIVTVEEASSPPRDLELPLDISADELVHELSLTLGWGSDREVFASPPGRVLSAQETLAQAGLQDGACLFLQPRGSGGVFRPSPSTPAWSPSSEALPAGPLTGWRPLPDFPPASSAPTAPAGGVVWRQIDED